MTSFFISLPKGMIQKFDHVPLISDTSSKHMRYANSLESLDSVSSSIQQARAYSSTSQQTPFHSTTSQQKHTYATPQRIVPVGSSETHQQNFVYSR